MRRRARRSRPTRRCWRSIWASSKASGSFRAEGPDLDSDLVSAGGQCVVLRHVAAPFFAQARRVAISELSRGAHGARSDSFELSKRSCVLMNRDAHCCALNVVALASVIGIDNLDG